MPIIVRPVRSSSEPTNTYPWVKLTFDPATRAVNITECNGLLNAAKEAAIKGQRALALTPGKLNEPHMLVITLAGDLRFLAFSDAIGVYYAHLAFYYPLTQTVEIIETVEM